jgi:hypothetical protein
MKFEIRRGKKGESHKFMCKVGGTLVLGANTIAQLMVRIQREVELDLEIEQTKRKGAA